MGLHQTRAQQSTRRGGALQRVWPCAAPAHPVTCPSLIPINTHTACSTKPAATPSTAHPDPNLAGHEGAPHRPQQPRDHNRHVHGHHLLPRLACPRDQPRHLRRRAPRRPALPLRVSLQCARLLPGGLARAAFGGGQGYSLSCAPYCAASLRRTAAAAEPLPLPNLVPNRATRAGSPTSPAPTGPAT